MIFIVAIPAQIRASFVETVTTPFPSQIFRYRFFMLFKREASFPVMLFFPLAYSSRHQIKVVAVNAEYFRYITNESPRLVIVALVP